jgi:hypothetical protein
LFFWAAVAEAAGGGTCLAKAATGAGSPTRKGGGGGGGGDSQGVPLLGGDAADQQGSGADGWAVPEGCVSEEEANHATVVSFSEQCALIWDAMHQDR